MLRILLNVSNLSRICGRHKNIQSLLVVEWYLVWFNGIPTPAGNLKQSGIRNLISSMFSL